MDSDHISNVQIISFQVPLMVGDSPFSSNHHRRSNVAESILLIIALLALVAFSSWVLFGVAGVVVGKTVRERCDAAAQYAPHPPSH